MLYPHRYWKFHIIAKVLSEKFTIDDVFHAVNINQCHRTTKS